jgi:transposase
MIIIGVDAHKQTHTLVAVDPTGRKLGQKVIDAVGTGHASGLRWAISSFGSDITWGIEDVRHVSRRLENDLMNAGQRVVRVPTQLMARTRASARTRGKSDPIDALAVARAVLREPDLPVARHDGASRQLKLLVDRRDDLISQRTATINRLVWRVHELDPARSGKPGSWISACNRESLLSWLADQPGLVAELAADEIIDIARLSDTVVALQRRLAAQVKLQVPTLLALPGCGVLSAAKIVAETADVTRFRDEAAFARHAGVAPVPAWSGAGIGRVRAGRTGNRQLNRALHKIAVTQVRIGGPGQAYYQRRVGEGDSSATALRCLKRKIARVVYRRLLTDHAARQLDPLTAT